MINKTPLNFVNKEPTLGVVPYPNAELYTKSKTRPFDFSEHEPALAETTFEIHDDHFVYHGKRIPRYLYFRAPEPALDFTQAPPVGTKAKKKSK